MFDFSVLMSLYIKENPFFLKQALESIYNSELLPTEVVMVLDGEITQEQQNVLNEYPQLKIIPLEENKGLSNALNIGLKHCKYDLVARMDTDDICHSMRFKKQVEFLSQNMNVDVVGTFSYKIDENGKVIGNLIAPIGHDEIYKRIWTCPFIHPTVMFRRDSILSIGGYNPNSGPRQDDYELWFRCAENRLRFDNIAEPLFYYRFFSDSIKRNNIKVGWYRMKVGINGCRKLNLSPIAYLGVCVPLFRSLLPYPLNVWFNNLMIKINPRHN